MAPSRTVLVGMPAVLTAIPPGRGPGSTTTTRLPKYAAWAAPFSPAGAGADHDQVVLRRHAARITRAGCRSCRRSAARPEPVGSSNSVPRMLAEKEQT